MPTYDYKCTKCGHDFQVFKKITSKPGSKCPECGGKAERQMSAGGGLVFKGSGFYLTDYGRNAHRKAGGDKQSSGDSGGGDSGGGESAAKSEPSGKAEPSGKSEKAESKTTESKPAESKPKKKKDD